MATHLQRSIDEPIRVRLTTDLQWNGHDRGLFWCWERGRQKQVQEPELAARAKSGELPILSWAGGVESKLTVALKSGTLQYLATWQGLRGEDLNISLSGETVLVCARTGQAVAFSAAPRSEDDS